MILEVGTHSPWVSRIVASRGHDAIVANPRRVRLIIAAGRKNDRIDAVTDVVYQPRLVGIGKTV